MEYTPRQQLEIRGAFYYIIGLSTICIVSAIMQYISMSSAGIKPILSNIIVNSFNVFLAIIIYIKKRKRLEVTILPWILGFITIIGPLAVRYNHAFMDGWTFASQSINTTAALIAFVILLSFFYRPKLFKFFSILAIFNWLLFLVIAYLNGAELYFYSHENGLPIITGLVVFREISLIISLSTVLVIISRNISDLMNYDDQSTEQTNQIINQVESRNILTEVIKEKTDSLFQQIDSQHTLLSDFNSNMESQAARFSEMSATMEEISGASEQIATESVSQVEGNVKMEFIIDEFRDIRLGTKRNLDETYNDIQSVSDQSATANEHLMEVEKTVYAIKDQSSRIGQIVELIVDIADRINLLSLNASIEAARAGESGRGFAVVADEIGKLAFQTQESIKEINNVISSSSKSTIDGATVIQKTAQMMRDMISRMDQGANKIQLLQESLLVEDKFTKIIIDQMNDNITQAKKISTATDEQKIAVATSFKAIEEVINILDGMSLEAKDMSKISDEIFYNATDIITETKQIASETETKIEIENEGEAEIASNNDYN
ncbi:MAG: methyl-accepting chemotaxis protein [Leptospirales bacterium]|nr:methyl-accepting chemotaxis protein [Leptospirales bacterium]